MISKVQVGALCVAWEYNSKIIISRCELGEKMTMTNSKSTFEYFLIKARNETSRGYLAPIGGGNIPFE